MAADQRSEYEGVGLRAVRPYLIVGDAHAAIDFYRRAFNATELELHPTPSGGVGHAKLRISETIVELGEHPDARDRVVEVPPRVGLRLYVADVDRTYAGRSLPAPPAIRHRTACQEPEARPSTTRSASRGGSPPQSSRSRQRTRHPARDTNARFRRRHGVGASPHDSRDSCERARGNGSPTVRAGADVGL
jgi:hypothetical protein